MHFLVTLLIGFFVGLLARFLHPGDDKMGIILTTLLGIGGAFTANYLGQMLGFYRVGERAGFFGAVLGAIVLLVAVGIVRRILR
ncbi:MAG: GlsB/YeaQ/YmgE family stress response membrane protein [Minicystis sp.]